MVVQWRAPGRVNLIGEHTDYNDGFVLPFALDAGCTATVSTRTDGLVAVSSRQLDERVELPLSALAPAEPDTAEPDTVEPDTVGHGGGIPAWAGYAVGAVWALRERGADITGVTIELDSDVPIGAGLSSSAALVCSVVTALDGLLGLGLDAGELLAVSRRVENDYVGAPTGGMDQLASLRCTEGHALFCDMRSLVTESVPLPLGAGTGGPDDLVLVVVDSHAPHRHADGEYRRRRSGCEQAATELGVPALRDVVDLEAALGRLTDDELRRYTRHIVTENARVLRTAELLRAGRLREIGPLLDASHASMRDDYRITIPEIDLIAQTLRDAGAVGARMTGGGFGGCVIGLIDPSLAPPAVEAARQALVDAGHVEPTAFTVTDAGRGAHAVTA